MKRGTIFQKGQKVSYPHYISLVLLLTVMSFADTISDTFKNHSERISGLLMPLGEAVVALISDIVKNNNCDSKKNISY